MAKNHSYIHIDAPLHELVQGHSAVYVIADKRFYDEGLEQFGIAGILGFGECGASVYWVEASEKEKSMETVEEICAWLLDIKADRDSILIGIGGGVITDLTGFVAAIYKRGIDVGYIPTTLLCAIDAAIGGKCGVNACGLKNMIGVVRQPLFVDILQSVVEGWSDDVIRDGYPEALKMDLLKERFVVGARSNDWFRDAEHVVEYAADKLEIVEQDPQDRSGIRARLNLGHTYGHAIEAVSGGAISHGEAVATGLVMIAERKSEDLANKIAADLAIHGVALHTNDYPLESLEKYIANDKKVTAGDIKFIEL